MKGHARGRKPRAHVPANTKIVRFVLNPHCKRHAQILQWLGGIRPYLRAEAMRSALEAYLNQPAEPTATHLPTGDAKPSQPLDGQAAEMSGTREKLKRMF